MALRSKNPADATATADDTEVRTAEQPSDAPADTEQPERDSHDDLVARVANLERHIL